MDMPPFVSTSSSSSLSSAFHFVHSRSLTHPLVSVNLLWEGGVGQEDPYGLLQTSLSSLLPSASVPLNSNEQFNYQRQVEQHNKKKRASMHIYHARAELLATLLSALSAILYYPTGSRETIFTESIISTALVPRMPTLTLSLLNTLLNYQPYGSLPYTSYFISKEEQVVLNSARVLAVLLCYQGMPLHTSINETENTDDVHAEVQRLEFEHKRDNNNINNDDNNTKNREVVEAANVVTTAKTDNNNKEEKKPQLTADAKNEHTNRIEKVAQTENINSLIEKITKDDKLPNQLPSSLSSEAPPLIEQIASSAPAKETLHDSITLKHLSSVSDINAPHATLDSMTTQPSPQLEMVHSVRKDMYELTLTEAKFVIDKLKSLIRLDAYSQLTYLPDSQHNIHIQDETMMILYKLLQLSPAMQVQFANSPSVLEYIIPLLHYGYKAVMTPYFINRLHLVLFILQQLSQVRGFVVWCNKPCKDSQPQPLPAIPANASYNDVIVLTLCNIIESEKPALRMVITQCTVILSNMAPFITSLTPLASLHLVMTLANLSLMVLRGTFQSHLSLSSSSSTSTTTTTTNSKAITDKDRTNTNVVSQQANDQDAKLHVSNESVDLYKTALNHTCEAIASLLQYQQIGSHYLILALMEFRHMVQFMCTLQHELKYQWISNSLHFPFLIDTLNMAISAALPLVEGVEVYSTMSVTNTPNISNNNNNIILKSEGNNASTTTSLSSTTSASNENDDVHVRNAMLTRMHTTYKTVCFETIRLLYEYKANHTNSLVFNTIAFNRLSSLTLVGCLPTPHCLMTKKMHMTKSVEEWALYAI